MLGPESFILILVVVFGLVAAWAVLLGVANRRRSGTSSARPQERRDVIAQGVVTEQQLAEMHEAENARLRARGRRELTRGELEARVAGDARTRWRLLRLRARRRWLRW
ncbi:MAG TPA: hypothetical protein VF549_05890 [Solirubrobacteraceae bacterium]